MVFLSATLHTIHLLCMMLASAGPMFCVWIEWSNRRWPNEPPVARQLAWHAVGALVGGALIGLVHGWILHVAGTRDYASALPVLRARLEWGALEFLFSLMLLVGYAVWFGRHRRSSWQRNLHRLLAVLAATNLLYHFPLLMEVTSQLAMMSPTSEEVLDASGFRQLAWTGRIIASAIHFSMASIIFSGIWAVFYLARSANRQVAENSQEGNRTEGMATSLVAARMSLLTVGVQFPVGLWLLWELPSVQQQQMLGADLWRTSFLAGAVLGAVGLLHQLAAIAFGEVSERSTRRALATVTMVAFLMVLVAT